MMCASTIDRYGHIYSQEEGGGAAYEGVIASLDQTTSGKACQILKKLGTNTSFDFQGTTLGKCI